MWSYQCFTNDLRRLFLWNVKRYDFGEKNRVPQSDRTGNLKIKLRGQCPNPWILQICYLTWRRDFSAVVKLRTLKWGDCPRSSERAHLITRVLKWIREKQKKNSGKCDYKRMAWEIQHCWLWRWQKRNVEGPRKKPRKQRPLDPSLVRDTALLTYDVSPVKFVLDFSFKEPWEVVPQFIIIKFHNIKFVWF